MKQLAAKIARPMPTSSRESNRPHQQRHERDDEQLRQSGPGHHLAGLLRVEPLRDREILRQQIGRAVKRETEQEIAQRAEAEIAPRQQPKPDQRLLAHQFDDDEGAKRDRRTTGSA